MKKILVPTDFSQEAASAIPYALEQVRLFGAEGCSVILLNVVQDFTSYNVQFEFGLTFIQSRELCDAAVKDSEQKLKEIAEKHFSPVHTSAVVLLATRPIHEEITAFAQKEGIFLLVIATHGRSGVKHLMLGSVTERIIRQAPCPVLVVPPFHSSCSETPLLAGQKER